MEVMVRVLLVSANRAEVNMRTIPLGLACVASAVRHAGHAVQMLDLMEAEDPASTLATAIHAFEPEVIGISLRNIDDQNMRKPRFFLDEGYRIIELAKNLSKAIVVLGGAGYSIFPEAILAHSLADMGIQGEGEDTFRLLLERLEGNQPLAGLSGLCVKGKGLQGRKIYMNNLDEFPLPKTDLFSGGPGQEKDAIVPVQSRRGCPMGCIYCSTRIIEGTKTRTRSPARFVEWVAQLNREGVRQLYVVDNTFNLPVPYAKDLCCELIRASLNVSWRCIIYPWKMDEGLAADMAESGCIEASVGFESGSNRMLKAMSKRFQREDVTRTCAVLKRQGIRRMGFLLLGGPGETHQSVEESLAFADSLDLESLKITLGIRIYPQTALARQANKEHMIASEDDLLIPKFYIMPGLEEWARETIMKYTENRPNWIVER
jgi:radical SAM superfamily enzyme YgiQ (UPF0313 family)